MTKYTVTWQELVTYEAEVEADTPENAIPTAIADGGTEVDSSIVDCPEVTVNQ